MAVNWLNHTLKDIGHEIFKDVTKVFEGEVKPMDDGQLVLISDINRITVSLETSTGEKRKLKAIAKLEALTGPGRDIAASCDAFTTEIMMYSDVLKSMEKLMLEVGDKNTLWPDCYHCGDNKLLLQDLSELGYRVVPTHHFLDVEHCLVVMKSLGKFHGLSMILKERSILTSKHCGMPYYARKNSFMASMHMKSINDLNKSIKKKWGPEWSSLPDRLLKYFENIGEKLHDGWKSSLGKWDVLNHGDFSMRNMLFHYPDGSSHPDGIKFVDFQMTHYSNLGNDLITLLYSSMKPFAREENMKLLLATYVESLTSTCKAYSYRGPLPTVNDVEQCIRSLFPLVITTIQMSIPFFVTSGKIDLQKQATEYMEKFGTCDDLVDAQAQGTAPELELNFDDEDVVAYLKFDFGTFMKNNAI